MVIFFGVIMGQAKRRGTPQERQAIAILRDAEVAAWKEYYDREYTSYQRWLFRRISPDYQIARALAEAKRQEDHRYLQTMLNGMIPLTYVRGR
jgi:hypothetical protein